MAAYGAVGRTLSNGHHLVSTGLPELSVHLRVLVNAQLGDEHYIAGPSRRLEQLSGQRGMETPW